MRRAQRIAQIGYMSKYRIEAASRHEFEGGDPLAESLAQRGEQLDRLARAVEGNPCRRARRGLGIEPQHRGGDHAERAFGAEEKLLQVVAGVVLAQAAQPVPYPAVGQHDFEPEHLLARIAVAQHVDAAGVGGKVAADLATALGGERKREEAACVFGGALHGGEHAARFDGGRVVQDIERADAVHAGEGKHDLAARARGHRAADEAGVAALRHDGDVLPRAKRHHLRHFLRRRRPHHAFRRGGILLAPVGVVRFRVLGRSEHICRAYNVGEALLQAHP
jgi:hypothetical protein